MSDQKPNPKQESTAAVEPLPALEPPVFLYRYPDGLPAQEQHSIETALGEANRNLAEKQAGESAKTYAEWSSARNIAKAEWWWELVSAAAPSFAHGRRLENGRVEIWSANRIRDELRAYADAALEAAQIPIPLRYKLLNDERWRRLYSLPVASTREDDTCEIDRIGVIRDRMTSKGLSPEQLANLAKVDRNTVRDYLKGKRKLRAGSRKQIADALDLTPQDIPEQLMA